jgi:putative addiction module component (TIGR02574 family)
MPLPLDALEAEVLNLPAVERSHLLDRLIASLEADPEIQRAWELEAERRDAEVEEGKVKLVPGEEVLARLRAELR